MDWADVLFAYGFPGVVLIAAVARCAWVFYNRRRCRACGRTGALRRVPGTRREGFVRARCTYCDTKQWGVIEPRSEGPTAFPP